MIKLLHEIREKRKYVINIHDTQLVLCLSSKKISRHTPISFCCKLEEKSAYTHPIEKYAVRQENK